MPLIVNGDKSYDVTSGKLLWYVIEANNMYKYIQIHMSQANILTLAIICYAHYVN